VSIAKEVRDDGKWQVLVNNKESISFLHLENTWCDGHVMVSEVKLKRNISEHKIGAEIWYNQLAVKTQLTDNINVQLCFEDIVVQVRNVLSLGEKSHVCRDLPMCEINDLLEMYQVKVENYFMTYGDINEER